MRVTQSRDTATPQVRVARVDTGSVIPRNARDPGVASGKNPRPGLGMTPHGHPERTRGICALRGAEIPRLRLGMTMGAMRLAMTIAALRLGTTVGALRCGKTQPSRGATPTCNPDRTRGICALRGAEIPRLWLGMTMGVMRLGMTMAALRPETTVGALRCEKTQPSPGSADAGLSSRADARDLGVVCDGDSSPAARNDNWTLWLGMTIRSCGWE